MNEDSNSSHKPWQNHEGYHDPTAYTAFRNIRHEEKQLEDRVNSLISVLKTIIDAFGFDLLARIEVRDRKTGRTFR